MCAGTGAVEECFGCVGLRALKSYLLWCVVGRRCTKTSLKASRHTDRSQGAEFLHMASQVRMAHGIEGAHVF